MKVVNRICCVCRSKQDKNQMIRIAFFDNQLFVDNQKKVNSKGCYVCNNVDCQTKLIQKKLLNRVYKCNIVQEQYEKLDKELKFATTNNNKD